MSETWAKATGEAASPDGQDRAAMGGIDLHLDPSGPRGRAGLETALRGAVQAGRLRPGTRLPPSRALAADLGIARNTVAEAAHQNPTAFPLLRPSLAPRRSPVSGSISMHWESPQYCCFELRRCSGGEPRLAAVDTLSGLCSRMRIVSGENPTVSSLISSGNHCWWKRGALTAC